MSDEFTPAGAASGAASRPTSIVLPGLSLGDKRLTSRGIRKRRSVPVIGYIGTSGHGKSASMVRDTLLTLAAGRPVLSTVELLDPFTGNPHPCYIPFTSWQQLHEFYDGDILMDEITGLMDARESAMPKHVRRLIPQMRRRRVHVRWSGIDWDNADRRLRQMTQAAAKSVGHLPDYRAVRAQSTDEESPLWAPNRWFMLTTYDAQTLAKTEDTDRLNQDGTPDEKRRRRRAKVMNRELWHGPGSLAFQAYDTMGVVAAVDNSCPLCGLRMREEFCKGHGERSGASTRRTRSLGIA